MILVTGATGFVGRHLVQALLDQGLPVRCFLTEYAARKPLPWDTEAPNAPELITGSLLDEELVFRAVSGVHTIFHFENAFWWGRLRQLERVEVAATRSLISAARSARVGRIISLSHLGAAPSSAYSLHRIKGQVEELIRNSGVAYTIIRSGLIFGPDDAFINHLAMMMRANPIFFVMPGMGEIVLHPIYIDDLVRALYLCMESIESIDRTLEIGGQEYVTFEDLVYTVMRVTGMQRIVLRLPPYLMRWITSIYSRILPRALMTPQWFDILATNRCAKLGNIYEYFGFQPRRFEDTLATYLPRRRHLGNLIRYTFRRRPRGF